MHAMNEKLIRDNNLQKEPKINFGNEELIKSNRKYNPKPQ